jgi:predicted TIM-barrel fold metal-dependent hydrolase
VHGFVKRVVGSRVSLARAVAWAVDRAIQGMATGADEVRDLDRRLAAGPGLEVAEEAVLPAVDAQADDLLAQLEGEDPALAYAASIEAAQEGPPRPLGAGEEEGLVDLAQSLRRYLRWAGLFAQGRFALTRTLVDLYPDVDLFTPMLVDFLGLEDAPTTTVLQQLELQEKISRLAMLGHLDAQVVPFVGFDPRRLGAVELVQEAVASYGCVGVKVYPLMGFLPLDNRASPPLGMSPEDARGVDGALERLYRWCADEQVPITAHSNPSNYAHAAFRNHSQPANWAKVLERWPDLRLNLGHFGWGGRADGWSRAIAEMTATSDGLYADIGNHDLAELDEALDVLADLYADPATGTIEHRLMFGTDWYMVASHDGYERFHDRVRADYASRFPGSVDAFMGGSALSFLGFDDPTDKNNRRLKARFERVGAPPPEWLA